MTFKTAVHRLQPFLFVLPLLAIGCGDGAHTPTEPVPLEQPKAVDTAPIEQEAPARARVLEELVDELGPAGRTGPAVQREKPVVSPARGGNGNGNGAGKPDGTGNGNGNGKPDGTGNGNGNGGGGRGGELKLDIQPSTWNTNWVRAEGTVQAIVRGQDAGKIDSGSVELVAEEGALSPRRVVVAGGHLMAFFAKAEAFELLGETDSGKTAEVTLRFTVGGKTTELTVRIRVVGPSTGGGDDGDDQAGRKLEIRPDIWKTGSRTGPGQVQAFLLSPDLANVDLDSIVLVGDKPDAAPVEPLDVRRAGKQLVARFAMNEALASLDEPKPGEIHTVKLRFSVEGTATRPRKEHELSDTVRVRGSR